MFDSPTGIGAIFEIDRSRSTSMVPFRLPSSINSLTSASRLDRYTAICASLELSMSFCIRSACLMRSSVSTLYRSVSAAISTSVGTSGGGPSTAGSVKNLSGEM